MENQKKNSSFVMKAVASVLWLNIAASPFVLALICDKAVVTFIGIVYGVLAWEMGKRFTPKWMRDTLSELVRDAD